MSLTDDDKQWLRAELASVRSDLEGKIESDGDQLARVRSDLEGKIEGVGDQLARVRSDLEAKIEGVETSLLTEFHKCLSE